MNQMHKRNNTLLVVTCIAILTIATGCGISITNHVYTYSGQRITKSNKNDAQMENTVNSQIKIKDGRN